MNVGTALCRSTEWGSCCVAIFDLKMVQDVFGMAMVRNHVPSLFFLCRLSWLCAGSACGAEGFSFWNGTRAASGTFRLRTLKKVRIGEVAHKKGGLALDCADPAEGHFMLTVELLKRRQG